MNVGYSYYYDRGPKFADRSKSTTPNRGNRGIRYYRSFDNGRGGLNDIYSGLKRR